MTISSRFFGGGVGPACSGREQVPQTKASLTPPYCPRILPTSKPNCRCKRLKKWGGSPGVTRTPDQRFRKPLLYPSELRGHGDVTPLSHVTLRARSLRNERLRFWSDAVFSTRGLARNPPALLIVPVHGLASLGDGLRKLVHARPEKSVPRAAKNSPPSSPSESKRGRGIHHEVKLLSPLGRASVS